jgi:acetolactate synthase-1/2/3 large subunit
MNIQELATAAEHDVDVKIIILNNQHLGLVRQQQSLFYNSNLSAVKFEQNVDYALTARAMGMKGVDLASASDPLLELESALLERGPCVINLPISETEMVFPMVAPGGANREMIHGEGA